MSHDDSLPGLFDSFEEMDDDGRGENAVTENREANFNRESGRFHDPDTGMFEPGSPPPDLDEEVNRYRGQDGRFKKRSHDLYDERAEERLDELWPVG